MTIVRSLIYPLPTDFDIINNSPELMANDGILITGNAYADSNSVDLINVDKSLPIFSSNNGSVIDSDNKNHIDADNAAICSICTIISSITINQQHFITGQSIKQFSTEYNGAIITIAEHTDSEIEINHWHPLKYAKIFSSNISGISNIKPNSRKKIKITFNSKALANKFLASPLLHNIGFTACIPSNLIYSYGVIRVDTFFLEEDF